MPLNRQSFSSATLVRLSAYGAFVIVIVVFAVEARGFLSFINIANVLQQSAIAGLLAFGLTLVVLGGGGNVVTGGIDLSVAATLGLGAAVYATLIAQGQSDLVAIGATLAVGVLVGIANGLAVVRLHILPLLATLAVGKIVSGLEFVLTQNSVVTATSPGLTWLAEIGPLDVPIMAWALVVATIALLVLVQISPFGLRLHAVGAHPEAARAYGLPVRPLLFLSYVFSGFLSAAAGILLAALLSGSSPGASEMLLPVVLAVLLGVVFSRRLVPTIGGTFLAVLFISILGNGFQLLNISSYWVNGVEGVLILFVVAWTTLSQREAHA